jgi:hypothetical protein
LDRAERCALAYCTTNVYCEGQPNKRHWLGLMSASLRKPGGGKMTSFRRLVMGIAETMAVLSIFFGTLIGGIYGAVSGAGIGTNLQGIGQVSTTGVVFGFIIGAILGFVLSSSLAATVFFFAQIERNTRGLLERERFEEPTQYRAAPRF